MKGIARFGVYLALSCYALWPLPLHLSEHLLRAEEADPYLVAHTLDRFARNLSGSGPSLWYDESFAPEQETLAFADPLIGLSLAAAPLRAVSGNPILAYNVLLLGAALLSGLAAHLLARSAAPEAGEAGAYFAGTAFLLAPMRLAHLRHLQLYATFLVPLLLLVAMRLRREGPGRRAATALALGAGLLLQGFLGFYLFALLLPILSLLFLLPGASRAGRGAGLGAILGAVLLVGAVYAPMGEIHRAHGFVREAREAVFWSARIEAFRTPPSESLAGRILATPGAWDREHQRYLGAAFVLAALAGIAARRRRLPGPRAIRFVGALALLALGFFLPTVSSLSLSGVPWSNPAALASLSVAFALLLGIAISAARPGPLGVAAGLSFLLSLGPLVLAGPIAKAAWSFGPYAILQALPGYASLRVPSRFAFVAIAALLPLVARGFARSGTGARAVLLAVLFAETWTGPHNLTPVETPSLPSLETRAAAALPADAILAEAPCLDDAAQARAVYRAGLHKRRVANGFASYWTPRNEAAREATRFDPRTSSEAAATLARLGVRFVLLPGGGVIPVAAVPTETSTAGDARWERAASPRVRLPTGASRVGRSPPARRHFR